MMNLSHAQIDLLGDRLRQGSLTESDLRMLDEYRRSFGEAYETVVRFLREGPKLEPTGRPAKSTGSLVEKLRRESIRLSQVQDIAGCRVVVADIAEQEGIAVAVLFMWPGASIIDRRADPSYGYRAVHVVSRISSKLVEIQVRTVLQHLWAELSEKLSDVVDPNIKYGDGPDAIRWLLATFSADIARLEEFELMITGLLEQHGSEQNLQELRERVVHLKKEIADSLNRLISGIGNPRRQEQ